MDVMVNETVSTVISSVAKALPPRNPSIPQLAYVCRACFVSELPNEITNNFCAIIRSFIEHLRRMVLFLIRFTLR